MSSLIIEIENKLDNLSISLSDLLLLRRELRAPFKRHPLGFIASTLLTEDTRKLRLHYWPGKAIRQSHECQIHDHLFNFKSWVLAGEIENIEYLPATQGQDFAVYQTHYSGDQSILIKTKDTIKLKEHKRQKYTSSMSYTLATGILHETLRSSEAPAITVLVTDDVSNVPAKVIGPLNGNYQYKYERAEVDEILIEKELAELSKPNIYRAI